ncbi:type III-B CRISPR module RAMP protein Cmr6, partial [Kutzneria sp. 744]
MIALQQRRAAAARALAARHTTEAPRVAIGIDLSPLWRLVVGHGEDTVHETGLSMSPTYGVPIIPGSSLKGLAARSAKRTELIRVCGAPRPRPDEPTGTADTNESAQRGTVTITDALPLTPPRLVVDVLTPHVATYYQYFQNTRREGPPPAPAEYHQPIPVHFLAVQDTTFRS